MSYGLPAGTSISYKQLGFPAWVDELCRQWGLDSSTYPGHQESDRPDIGAAPNPQRLNRGIDWAGPPDKMLAFAKWCRDNGPSRTPGRYGPEGLEMVIFQHPQTGERVWYPPFVNYGADFGGHRDHVHTRHSAPMIGVAPTSDATDVLAEAMGHTVSRDRYRQLLPAVTDALRRSDCLNVNRVAMWCAQIGHESVGLKYMKEIGDAAYFAKYNNRADLGNGPTDGPRYPGRGPIQITGRHNYRKLSEWAHSKWYVPTPTFFEDHPEKLELDEFAFLGAIWYWTVARPDINTLSDRRDLETVTRRINGGLNGLDDRRNRYNRALAIGERLLTLIGSFEEDDWMANPELERMIREVHAALFNRVVSESRYRHLGEGPRWQLHEMIRHVNAFAHEEFVEREAREGDPEAIALVYEVANADPQQYPDRQQDAAAARRFLDSLTAATPAPAPPPAGVAAPVNYEPETITAELVEPDGVSQTVSIIAQRLLERAAQQVQKSLR